MIAQGEIAHKCRRSPPDGDPLPLASLILARGETAHKCRRWPPLDRVSHALPNYRRLLVGDDGRVRVLDFGLARGERGRGRRPRAHRRRRGARRGAPCPLEQNWASCRRIHGQTPPLPAQTSSRLEPITRVQNADCSASSGLRQCAAIMPPVNTEPLPWFRQFHIRLHDILASGVVAHLRPVAADFKDVTFGWYTPIACLDRAARPAFQVWLDTYLNEAGSYHLGCWYLTDRKTARSLKDRLARAWDIVEVPEYNYDHRDDDDERLLTKHGKREETRITEPLLDVWDRDEAYAGLYIYPAPTVARSMEPVIDAAVDALRRLADVVRGKPAGVTLPADPSPTDAERLRRLAEILVRPAQQLLRREALVRHGACLITGETEPAALEAAHIRPVYAGGSDTMDNVLLLRADLHRLFDAGLLTIMRGRPPCVLIAGGLLRPGSDYATLATLPNGGRTIGEAQWVALDARNQGWDPDRGLTQTVARRVRSPLLVPSLHR